MDLLDELHRELTSNSELQEIKVIKKDMINDEIKKFEDKIQEIVFSVVYKDVILKNTEK